MQKEGERDLKSDEALLYPGSGGGYRIISKIITQIISL